MKGVFMEYIKDYAFEPSMLIQNIVTVMDAMIVFTKISKKKNRMITVFFHFISILFLLVILNGIWEVLFSTRGSYFLTHIIIIAGYVWFLGNIRKKSYIITGILLYSIEVCMVTFSSIFPNVLADSLYGDIIEIYLRNAIVLLTLGAAVFFRTFNINKFGNMPVISVVYACLIGTVTTALATFYVVFYSSLNAFGNVFALIAYLCILIINFVAYYLDYAMCQHYDAERQLIAENYITQSDKYMLEISLRNLEDMRKIRHDIKNQYSYLGILLNEKRYEEMTKYFQEMQESMIKPLSYIDCGNKNINAILNLEFTKAHAKGIMFDYRLMVSPELPFVESDMCSLLTNLIDNAIEACERMKLLNSIVEVGINQRQSILYICVVNPIDEAIEREKMLSLKTTKGNPILHGYGTKIVEGIVNKYNGHINRSLHNGKYMVDIMLDLKWNENQ